MKLLILYSIPLILILAWYLLTRKKAEKAAVLVLEETIASGLTEPPTLHPVIDPKLCVGSAGCEKVCPEEAIGIIKGKAVLVNPSECIGHGACAAACPMHAITLVFGTERRGIDIPMLKPNFESNVPGIFIAGELGGMGLIRKAVEQGKQAIDSVRSYSGRGSELDVVIVGAGPAGLTAALGAIQHKLKYALVEQEDGLGGTVYHYPRNKVTMTAPMQLPIVGKVKFGEVQKEKLLEFWNDVVKKQSIKVRFGEQMSAIERVGSGFQVKTSGKVYRSNAVLLSIGRRGTPRKLDVPGESQSKVMYRLIDAEQYRGKKVLVVGGGDSALEAAIQISEQPGTKVTLSYRGDVFGRVKPKNRERFEEAKKAGRITSLLGSSPVEIGVSDVTIKVGDRTAKIPNDAVIICAGGVLPTDLLKKVGIEFQTKFGTE